MYIVQNGQYWVEPRTLKCIQYHKQYTDLIYQSREFDRQEKGIINGVKQVFRCKLFGSEILFQIVCFVLFYYFLILTLILLRCVNTPKRKLGSFIKKVICNNLVRLWWFLDLTRIHKNLRNFKFKIVYSKNLLLFHYAKFWP